MGGDPCNGQRHARKSVDWQHMLLSVVASTSNDSCGDEEEEDGDNTTWRKFLEGGIS